MVYEARAVHHYTADIDTNTDTNVSAKYGIIVISAVVFKLIEDMHVFEVPDVLVDIITN